jgi:hypothetical protein
MKKRRKFNSKRRIRESSGTESERELLAALAITVSYTGNPAHKRNPSDFGLDPPAAPREGKTLCDELGVVTRNAALEKLRAGVTQGLISIQERNGFPQNIWAVCNDKPVEAQLENPATGEYHGYPLQKADPFGSQVLRRWNREDE